jgi:tetratricopeptide (TPR) repeat protein
MNNKIALAALSVLLLGTTSTALAADPVAEPKPGPPEQAGAHDPHAIEMLWQKKVRLAGLAFQKGDMTTALSFYREALDQASVLGKKDPRYLISLNDLVQFAIVTASYSEAEPLAKQLVDLSKEVNGLESRPTVEALMSLAKIYRAENKTSDADPVLNTAVSAAEALVSKDKSPAASNLLAEALTSRALFLVDTNRIPEAEPFLSKALSIRESSLGPNDPLVAGTLNNLAEILRAQNKISEAITLYERARRIFDTLGSNTNPQERANLLSNLALAYKADSKFAEAKPLLVQALSIDSGRAPYSLDTAMDLYNLATIHQALNELSEAEIMYQQALPILERKLGTDHPLVATTWKNIGTVNAKLGKPAAAESAFKHARSLLQKATNPSAPTDLAEIDKALLDLVQPTSAMAPTVPPPTVP